METMEWTVLDRSQWDESLMVGECDKKQWVDPGTGLACLIVRQPRLGHWCGYVGVPEGHKYYGVDDADVPDISVHGGLTFSNFCHESDDPSRGICHVSDEKVWWLGFDCAHAFDLSPLIRRMRLEPTTLDYRDIYRTQEYVESQCTELAKQLANCQLRGGNEVSP